MGSWFSNFHLRVNDEIRMESVIAYFTKLMAEKHYLPTTAPEDADVGFALLMEAQDRWLTVSTDVFSFEEPAAFAALAKPMTEQFHTQILGISCFDSDYLYLNLIGSGMDAWASVGSAAGLGISRRKRLSDWAGQVDDFPLFKEKLRQKYCCAEEVLWQIADCLKLSPERSSVDYDHLDEYAGFDTATRLYFRLADEGTPRKPTVFDIRSFGQPQIDQPNLTGVLNIGGASRGITVVFQGPGLQDDALVPYELTLICGKCGNYSVEAEKVFSENGACAYVFRCPTFPIPEKPDERLPVIRHFNEELKRTVYVRFFLKGNPRKLLDFDLWIIPDKYRDNALCWNPWKRYGSKAAYIKHHNARFPSYYCLREEDFD